MFKPENAGSNPTGFETRYNVTIAYLFRERGWSYEKYTCATHAQHPFLSNDPDTCSPTACI